MSYMLQVPPSLRTTSLQFCHLNTRAQQEIWCTHVIHYTRQETNVSGSLSQVTNLLGAGNGVTVEVVVDVGCVSWVCTLNVTGDLGGRRRAAATATAHSHLCAADVELLGANLAQILERSSSAMTRTCPLHHNHQASILPDHAEHHIRNSAQLLT